MRQAITQDLWAEIFGTSQPVVSGIIGKFTPFVEAATEEDRPTAEEAKEAAARDPQGQPHGGPPYQPPPGGGTVTCVIKVDGVPLSRFTATGGFNIADCEIGQDPITNLWEDDNSG